MERKNKYEDYPNEIVRAAFDCKELLDKYFRKFDLSDAYLFASICDPRMKLAWLNKHFDQETLQIRKEYVLRTLKEKYQQAQPEQSQLPGAFAEDDLDSIFGNGTVEQEFDDIEKYLNENRVANEPDFDVLKWWRQNGKHYPTMAKVARDYLGAAATSTSCERMFSGGRDTIGIRRHCLNAESIQALQVLKSLARDDIELYNENAKEDEEAE